MTSKELKVGNWVSYKGDIYPITDSSDNEVVTITNENDFEMLFASKLEPIKIVGKMFESNGNKYLLINKQINEKLFNIYYKFI